uniref:Uncharacterized protein n=2 Tax=Brassica oleracea TaxID=3712 RepID=A0A0D3A0F5_BRAOL|nr:unnamed protein product [Brassica oleracea]
MITSCAYLANMFITLVMEEEQIFAIDWIIANLAKIFRLTVAVDACCLLKCLVSVLFTLEMSDEFVTYLVNIIAYVANAQRFFITQ